MSLNWDLTRIKDWEKVCLVVAPEDRPMADIKKGDEVISEITEALIWTTLCIGMSEITEKNFKEFYKRMVMLDAVSGKTLIKGRPITLAEVEKHIGLRTNASRMTGAEFYKHALTVGA